MMPEITMETLRSWKASGIFFRLVRVKGGYRVEVR
jgi:hypothetical protein